MSTWEERAHGFIATLGVPDNVTLKDARRIFRANGGRFHGGTYWGRRAWGKATRKWLIARGLVDPPPYKSASPHLFAADIIFPFRGKP